MTILIAGRLVLGESDAKAQFLNIAPCESACEAATGTLVLSAGLTVGGLAVAPLILDIIQGAEFSKRGHTTVGLAGTNLAFSLIELAAGTTALGLMMGQGVQKELDYFAPVSLSIAVIGILHASSSIAWSIYGLRHTGPAVADSAQRRAALPFLVPAPTLLHTPMGTAPGISLLGRF